MYMRYSQWCFFSLSENISQIIKFYVAKNQNMSLKIKYVCD